MYTATCTTSMNNGGIYMTALQPADETATGAARFADVLVEGCYVARVSRWGSRWAYLRPCAVPGCRAGRKTFLQYGHENVVLRDNYVKAAGGDGLTVMYALAPAGRAQHGRLRRLRDERPCLSGAGQSHGQGGRRHLAVEVQGMRCCAATKPLTRGSIRTAWPTMPTPATARCMSTITAA